MWHRVRPGLEDIDWCAAGRILGGGPVAEQSGRKRLRLAELEDRENECEEQNRDHLLRPGAQAAFARATPPGPRHADSSQRLARGRRPRIGLKPRVRPRGHFRAYHGPPPPVDAAGAGVCLPVHGEGNLCPVAGVGDLLPATSTGDLQLAAGVGDLSPAAGVGDLLSVLAAGVSQDSPNNTNQVQ